MSMHFSLGENYHSAAKRYHQIGNQNYQSSNYLGAIINYKKSLQLESNNEIVYYDLGQAKSALGDYQGAISDYNQAIQIKADYAMAYNSRGFSKYKLSDYRGAISDLNHAIKINPRLNKAHENLNLALLKLESEKIKDKTEDYSEGKQLDSNFISSENKQLLLHQLVNICQKDFLKSRYFYEVKCAKYISENEYLRIKQNLVSSWVETHLISKIDLEQSLAISSVNSHVQLIARAGSGKTSTLVNRAIFLQRHCGIKSSEILLLAFNRKAAQEIRERLQNHLQHDLPYAMTFHALAYALVRPDETLVLGLTQRPKRGKKE